MEQRTNSLDGMQIQMNVVCQTLDSLCLLLRYFRFQLLCSVLVKCHRCMKPIWRKWTYKRTQRKTFLLPSLSHEPKSNQNRIKYVGQTVGELGPSPEGRNSGLITAVLINKWHLFVRGGLGERGGGARGIPNKTNVVRAHFVHVQTTRFNP